MAWENRKGTDRRYYCRSYWEPGHPERPGRVRRWYIGSGPTAQAIAEGLDWLAEEEAVEREAQREVRRQAERQRDAEAARFFGRLEVLDVACDVLVRQALEAAGYHQHKGQWRKKRTGGQQHHADQEAQAAAGDGYEGAGAGV